MVGRWVVEELDFVAPWLHLDGSTMHASPLALASVTGELEGTRGTSPAGASERARARGKGRKMAKQEKSGVSLHANRRSRFDVPDAGLYRDMLEICHQPLSSRSLTRIRLIAMTQETGRCIDRSVICREIRHRSLNVYVRAARSLERGEI